MNPLNVNLRGLTPFVRIPNLCLPIMALLLASCSMKSRESVECSPCRDYFASMQTRTQGISDARRHIREKGYRILRYDMPIVRTGYWEPYFLPFQHFGIKESNELFASLDYCQGYNSEMDRNLLKRYGTEYRRLRSNILPKPGASRPESQKVK